MGLARASGIAARVVEGGWPIFGFLVATAALAIIAKRINVAYPIVFVVAGALLGFVPDLPNIELQPDTIFLIVLPIFLFSGGWTTDWTEFKRNLRPIGLAAIGLVVFTTVMVAAIAHAVIAGISWPAAYVLGAIVAPTDAIAAEVISEDLSLPRRIMTIISGEALVNDASSLIIYRFAIGAALTGTFLASHVLPQFFLVSIGGIAIGLGVAAVLSWAHQFIRWRDLDDEVLENVINLFAPFACYLPAEALGVSGVLAAVAGGIYMSRRSGRMSADARIVGYSVWEMMTYLLNALVFLLLGLQLHRIVATLGHESFERLMLYGFVISVAVIVLRFIWIYPATYVPRLISKHIREVDPSPPWTWPAILSWAGMRGIVSLAAALAIPVTMVDRDAIIFVTFCVIFATLVVMGSTLPFVIRILKVRDDGRMEKKEIEIRIKALEAGMSRVRELEPTFDSEVEWEVEGRIIGEYQHRIQHLQGHLELGPDGEELTENKVDHQLQKAALLAERTAIQSMRRGGQIPDDIYRAIEYDLDLADARLRQG
ncbi:MAG TPA: Na+/H+ antiporter [Candidatus Baltobacteraceae bacterium]